MRNIIKRARERMSAAYIKLPDNYFNGKGAANYRFNNITKLIEKYPELDGPVNDVVSKNMSSGPISLYFGVPWCEKICSFCNFAYGTSSSSDVHNKYIENMARELKIFRSYSDKDIEVSSVYFGGGTPTFLNEDTLDRYLKTFISNIPLLEKHSITCEFSTNTISERKLEVLKKNKVTRVSTGVQSLDDDIRKRANLVGTGEDAMEALIKTQKEFENFNIDLIYGHPYQTEEDWYTTVSRISEMDLPSITLYRLEVKERTTFMKTYIRNESAFVEEKRARLHYFIAKEILEEKGYSESPLGWWLKEKDLGSKPSWKIHLASWKKATPYFGFGQGAFTLINGLYYENHAKLINWEKSIADGQLPIEMKKGLDGQVSEINQLMRLLRVAKRVDIKQLFKDSHLENLYEVIASFFRSQSEYGLMAEEDESNFRLTEAGESLVHWLFDDLLVVVHAFSVKDGNLHMMGHGRQ